MDAGTEVKVVKYETSFADLVGEWGDDPSGSPVGLVGVVVESPTASFYARVVFDLPPGDVRDGEWLFEADEIEVVE